MKKGEAKFLWGLNLGRLPWETPEVTTRPQRLVHLLLLIKSIVHYY